MSDEMTTQQLYDFISQTRSENWTFETESGKKVSAEEVLPILEEKLELEKGRLPRKYFTSDEAYYLHNKRQELVIKKEKLLKTINSAEAQLSLLEEELEKVKIEMADRIKRLCGGME